MGILENLQRRFPTKASFEIQAALDEAGGHGGQAVGLLMGGGGDAWREKVRNMLRETLTKEKASLPPIPPETELITAEALEMDSTVQLSITPEKALTGAGQTNVLVSVIPPDGKERAPSDICCVIDVSLSMTEEASIKNAKGEKESHGLNLLDIAKHAVLTIVKTLTSKDRLSVVAFSNGAEIIFPLMSMDGPGQEDAASKLEKLQPVGGTSLWNGLQSGMDVLRRSRAQGRLAHLILLTDGVADDKHIVLPNMHLYKEVFERMPCTISTYGFGYNIDSKMLGEIAIAGSGSYSFIPDPGFVGTVFVNAISNLLVTMATEVYLTIEPDSGAGLGEGKVLGAMSCEDTGGFYRIGLGTLQYGQSRGIVVPMSFAADASGPYLVASLQYETRCAETGKPITVGPIEAVVPSTDEAEAAILVQTQWCRCAFVDACELAVQAAEGWNEDSKADEVTKVFRHCDENGDGVISRADLTSVLKKLMPLSTILDDEVSSIMEAADKNKDGSIQYEEFVAWVFETDAGKDLNERIADLQKPLKFITQISKNISATPAAATEAVSALLEDINGQVSEALSRFDWYQKWGSHYLPSIANAHRAQQCVNFKDPGVQLYGGELFQQLQEEADNTFNELPAPKATSGVAVSGIAPKAAPGRAAAAPERAAAAPAAAPVRDYCPAPPVSMSAYNDRYGG